MEEGRASQGHGPTTTPAPPPPGPIAVLRGHESAVNAVALHVPPTSTSASAPEQPLLVSGDASGALWLWSLRTRRRLRVEPRAHVTRGGEGGVLQVALVEGGRRVLSQGRGPGSRIRLWATERLGCSSSFTAACEAAFPVASLAFCKLSVLEDGDGSGGGGDRCLFATYGEEEEEEEGSGGSTAAAERMRSGETVALWDLRTRRAVARFGWPDEEGGRLGKTGMCMCLRLVCARSGGHPCLVSAWENGHLYAWDVRSPSVPFASTATASGQASARVHSEPPLALDLAVVVDQGNNGGGECIVRGVSGGADAQLGMFCMRLPNDDAREEGEQPIRVEERLELGHQGVSSVCIRGDQRIFATGGWDKRIRVWDFKRRRPLAILKTHTGAINCLAFAHSTNLMVSGSADTRIACWSLY